ncbi:unnamed protein product [Caenorhabditis sp. 36 PRJEB53466]|nr:unnamed protein product [Caenorhabditis sp. 36 PRJEB53466]
MASAAKNFPIVETDGEKYVIFTDKSIGRGAYSEVYEGRTAPGRLVAIKTACKRAEIQAMRIEVEILRKLRGSPNIVQYIGSVNERMAPGSVPAETFSFAMEYARSSLEAEMRRPENLKGLPADVLIDLVVDCSLALSALHRNNIAHRDIKHMNILLFPGSPTHGRRSCHLFKLCDMGCSKALLEESSNEMRTLVGTPNLLHPYLAKEMVDPQMDQNLHDWRTKKAYTPEQCDLWSLGCTLYFCATGKFPFDHERNNKRLYYNAVNALTQNPDAIGMTPVTKGRDSGRNEMIIEFEPVTELPAKYTRYPRWLVCTLTCIIRQFFHNPSIEDYAKVANAMRTARRRTFLSVDQLSVIDHTDMSNVSYVGFCVPTLSVCLGYPEGTNLRLISNTSTQYIDSKLKSLECLHDDIYLVDPQEFEDMIDRKLVEIRSKKCYDGLTMLTETDEYCELFERTSKILTTQFNLLVDELSHFERVQTTSRFAVYIDMASVPMILFDGSNPGTKNISEKCIQQAKQAREELERHARMTMNIEQTAKQLARDSKELQLDDVDLPGIRLELESYLFYRKTDILATREYSQSLVLKCLKRRNHVMEQIFKSPDGIRKSKLKHAMDLAASLNQLRSDYHKLQNTISECVDLLERPFQEMKEIVNRHLQEQGHSRNSMERSMRFLAPEFREDQKRVKAVTRSSKELVHQLNRELEDSIKQLGFVRIGDTLMKAESEERTLVRPEEEAQTGRKSLRPTPFTEACCASGSVNQSPNSPKSADTSVTTTEESDTSQLTYSSSEISTASVESTPPSSPPKDGTTYLQAVMQYFKPSSEM